MNIKGFFLYPNFLTKKEELELIKKINKKKWVVDYQRRLQYYNYRNELTKPYDLIPIPQKIPKFLEELIDKLENDKIIDQRPDQIIINEYRPGEGLKPHTDRKDYYQNTILGISLGSGTAMQFISEKNNKKKEIYIPRRSLYIMEDDARYLWKHAIPPRKNDIIDGVIYPRQTRISITFRNVVENKVKY